MIIPNELYFQILRIMPIPCVDLIITNVEQEVLLVKRLNEPAKDKWWFPGGRVHHNEKRIDAARRKLFEEVGIRANYITKIEEILTDEVMLPLEFSRGHYITTVYRILVNQSFDVVLDNQSSMYKWMLPYLWLKEENVPEFVLKTLKFNSSSQYYTLS